MVYSPAAAGNLPIGRPSSHEELQWEPQAEPEWWSQDQLALADHFLRVGELEGALQLLHFLTQENPNGPATSQSTREAAQGRLDAILGQGGTLPQRLEGLGEQFVDQVMDPVNLAAFGVAFGVRSAVSTGVRAWLGRGLAPRGFLGTFNARILPGLTAFAAEVPAFVATRRNLSGAPGGEWGPELLGTALFLGSLQLGTAVTKPLLRQFPTTPWLQRGLTHGIQYAAIYGGLSLEHTFLASGSPAWERRAVESAAVFLQLQALGRLTLALGNSVPTLEPRSQTFSPQYFSELTPASNAVRNEAFSPSTNVPSSKGSSSAASPLILHSVGAPRGLDLSLYEGRLQDTRYGSEVVSQIKAIESGEPFFVPRWLDVLTTQVDRGSLDQVIDVDVLNVLYRANPRKTSLDSWEGARLQSFIREALRDPNAERGHNALYTLHQIMRVGLNSPKLEHLFPMFGYDFSGNAKRTRGNYADFLARHRRTVQSLTRAFGGERCNLIAFFIFQHASTSPKRAQSMMEIFLEGKVSSRVPEGLIELAIDGIRNHPLRDLGMRRIFLNLATHGLPAKLLEMAYPSRSTDSFGLVRRWHREGYSIDEIASRIKGTEHTGYITEGSLARLMAETLVETAPYLEELSSRRQDNYRGLLAAINEVIQTKRILDPSTFMLLLGREDHPQVADIIREWLTGEFNILNLEPGEFDRRVSMWGGEDLESCPHMYFDQNFENRGPHLIMRRPPELVASKPSQSNRDMIDISNPIGRGQAHREILSRIQGIVHEYRHFDDYRLAGGPFPGTRRNRVVLEMRAYLEEFRWRVRNSDSFLYDYSQRLGVTLGTYLRDRSERNYFTRYDHQVAEKYFPEEP